MLPFRDAPSARLSWPRSRRSPGDAYRKVHRLVRAASLQPHTFSRPSLNSIVRSQRLARSRLWVTIKKLAPLSRFTFRIN